MLRRNGLSKDLRVTQNASAIRIEPCQHGVAARSAQWKCTIRSIESHATSRQAIDVRRFGFRIAIAAEHVVEVVRNQKQHVGLFVGGGEGLRKPAGC